ncbi:hypothetical protein LY39_02552 [Roseinatronobacter bogoriensis subsp. barguzinensis]|uniref:Uncharacterized protein n=2 Tax=Roseinatronobacter bogoriensis TaxID=119542 RepID=A0A2K8KA52_9RHOB|nr:hypothetical protein BG454_01980 [Rhodobaca barguzinensis]TDW38197.1 hypothetical protein LY39_02552 [Rhodobaca barguzinensis]TDY69632.1 hypothetical protein EV660_10326 [Rhodobaca bogoriensis DSM 18756]
MWKEKPMFQFLSEVSTPKASEPKMPFMSFGKAKAKAEPDERVNTRIDLLSENLDARLPDRGYIKH